MTILVEWDNPQQTIIRYTYISPWYWEDYYNANCQASKMLASVGHCVDVLFDFRRSPVIPQGGFGHFRRTLHETRPLNMGRVVTLGASGIMVVIGNILRSFYPNSTAHFFSVRTEAEAYNILNCQELTTDPAHP
jgi:hypothetical protein